jgi:murein L,D-transpeptidase YcbB/YkuD
MRSSSLVLAAVALLAIQAASPSPQLWVAAGGRVTPDAVEAIAILGAAADDGLDPSDYGLDQLIALRARVEAATSSTDAARFDTSLTAAMLHFLQDLRRGRVAPSAGGCSFPAPPDDRDVTAALYDGALKHRLRDTVAELRPPFQQYERLRAALASYRRNPESPARRTRQIELAMERLRWLPPLRDERLVLINIPMFQLWAWDARRAGSAPDLAMRVIVGRAMRTQTPVLIKQMTQVVFKPHWTVPASIVRSEILPRLQRDPSYLRKQNMDIVSGAGGGALLPIDSPGAIAQLRAGTAQLRQRPGPNNALGPVKFVFPNEENVFLHGTPAASLFSRSRRDFSHGCIRVEDPLALAEWTLADQGEWPRARIESAVKGPASTTVTLAQPVRVILFYTTAAVMPDGTLQFADDIYGFDLKLERALAAAGCR